MVNSLPRAQGLSTRGERGSRSHLRVRYIGPITQTKEKERRVEVHKGWCEKCKKSQPNDPSCRSKLHHQLLQGKETSASASQARGKAKRTPAVFIPASPINCSSGIRFIRWMRANIVSWSVLDNAARTPSQSSAKGTENRKEKRTLIHRRTLHPIPPQERSLHQLGNRRSLLVIKEQATPHRIDEVLLDPHGAVLLLLPSLVNGARDGRETHHVARVLDRHDLLPDVAEVGEGSSTVDHLVEDAPEGPDVGGASELREGKVSSWSNDEESEDVPSSTACRLGPSPNR